MAEEFKALLGAELESGALNNIQKQIDSLGKDIILSVKADRAMRDVATLKSFIRELKKETKGISLDNIFGKEFKFSSSDFKKLDTTLEKLNESVDSIRKSFESLGSNNGLTNIGNSIENANKSLSDMLAQFRELNALINTKSLEFKFNIGAGNTTAAYGRAARQSIAELRQQASAIEEAFRVATNATSGYEAVFKAAAGTNQMSRLFELAPNIGDASQSLRQQMDVYREYIQISQEIAKAKGIDLSGVTSGFGRSANEIIDAAERVQDGTAQTEQNIERLRGILGGGIGAEELTAQVDRVCNSLDEIRTSLNGLGENIRFEGLIEPFNRLTASIENLLNNAVSLRTTLGSTMNATGSSIGEVAQNAERLYDINLRTMAAHVDSVTSAMQGFGFSSDAISNVTRNLENLRIAITNVQTATRRDGGIDLSIQGIGQGGEKVYATRSYDNLGNFIEEARNPTKVVQSFNQIDNAAKELLATIKEMGNLDTKLIMLDPAKDVAQIEVIQNRLEALRIIYDQLFETNRSNFSTEQLDKLENALKSAAEKAEMLYAKLSDGIRADLNSSSFDKQVNQIKASFNALSIQGDDASAAIKNMEKALNSMKGANSVDELISSWKEFVRYAQQAQGLVQSASFTPQVKLGNQMTNWLKKNANASDDVRQKVENLINELKNCDKQRLNEIENEFDKLSKSVDGTKDSTISLRGVLVDLAARYLSFADICNYIERSFKAMYENVLEIDTAMTNLYKVTDETADRYDKFLTTAAKKSKDLGRNMASYIEQTADWTKLGFSLDDAEQLSELSSVYANVGEVDDATAVSDIVTSMKAFNIEASNAITIIDSLNELGNRFATNAADLGTGLTKSASAMNAAGVDMQHTLAMLTGITEITQNSSEAGNALKVFSMRIRGMKGELEELGEEVGENVDSISKVQTQILNLTKGKVNIFDDAGEFRDYYEIMQDISKEWDKLNSIDRANLSEILFGKMRGNQGQALIQAFQSGQITKALETAQKSAGSAMKEQEKWMESLEAKLGSLDAVIQSISNHVLDSDLLKGGIDALTGILSIVDKLTGSLGSLGTILLALPIGIFAGNMVNELVRLATAAKDTKEGFDLFASVGKAASSSLGKMGSGISNLKSKMIESIASAGGLGKALINAFKTHPILLAIAAVTAFIGLIDLVTTSAREAAEKFNDAVEEYGDAKQKVIDINTELETTKTKIDELQRKGGLTFVEQAELERLQSVTKELELQKQLAEWEEQRAAKEVAKTATQLYEKKYGSFWHGGRIDEDSVRGNIEKYNNFNGDYNLAEDSSDLNSLIAAQKIYTEKKAEAYEAVKEIIENDVPYDELTREQQSDLDLWEHYRSEGDKVTDTLRVAFAEINELKNSIEEVPYDSLSQNQKDALDAITADWEYLYQLLDPAGWKTVKFDEIFENEDFEKQRKELIELAKLQNGFLNPSDYEYVVANYKPLLDALVEAGFTIQDLFNDINSEAGSINFDVALDQTMADYYEAIGVDPNGENNVDIGVNVEVEEPVNDAGMSASELLSYLTNLSEEDQKIFFSLGITTEELKTLDIVSIKQLIDDAKKETKDTILFSDMIDSEDYQRTYADIQKKAEALQTAISGENVDYNELSQLFDIPITSETTEIEFIQLLEEQERIWHEFVLAYAEMAQNEVEKAEILSQESNLFPYFELPKEPFDADAVSGYISQIENLYDTIGEGIDDIGLYKLSLEYPELQIDPTVPEDQYEAEIQKAISAIQKQITSEYYKKFNEASAEDKSKVAAEYQYVMQMVGNIGIQTEEFDSSVISDLRGNINDLQDKLIEVYSDELTDSEKANMATELWEDYWQDFQDAGIEKLDASNLEEGIKALMAKYRQDIDSAFREAIDALMAAGDLDSANRLQKFWESVSASMYSMSDADLKKEAFDEGIVDDYIGNIESLYDALGKIRDGEFSSEDLFNLQKVFGDAINPDDLEGSINQAIADTSSKLDAAYDQLYALTQDPKWLALKESANAMFADMVLSLNATFDIDAEVEGFNALYDAIGATNDALGVNAETVQMLTERYRALKDFNVDELFEYTSSGIHVNTKYAHKLEKAYQDLTKVRLEKQLEDLRVELERNQDELRRTGKLSEGMRETDAIIKDIQNVQSLVGEYDGLISKYNRWKQLQSQPDTGSQFRDIVEGKEELDGLAKEGAWGSQYLQSYLDMFSYTPIEDYEAKYKSLDDTIKGTSFSLSDFIKGGGEGVTNLLKAMEQIDPESINFDGNQWNINATAAEMELLASKLGVSTEFIEHAFEQIRYLGGDLQIIDAVDDLESLAEKADIVNEALKEVGEEPLKINFEANTIEDIDTEIGKIKKSIGDLIDVNENGEITLKPEVSQAEYNFAMDMLEYMAQKKAELVAPGLMSIQVDASDGLDEVEKAVLLMQQLNTQFQIGTDTKEAQTEIQNILTQLNGLSGETKAKLGLDTDEFTTAVNSLSQTEIQPGVSMNSEDVATIQSTLTGISADIIATVSVNDDQAKNYSAPNKQATVIYNVNDRKVSSYDPPDKYATVYYSYKTHGASPVNGTAHNNGTAFVQGTAYRHGDWGTKGSGVALGGELGMETVVRDGRYYTIGDNGAEFFQYKKGDIIFNHKQTEELFKYGKVTSGGGRGKAFVEGTAFANGYTGSWGGTSGSSNSSNSSSGGKKPSSSSSSNNSNSSSSKDDFKEIFDWIEVAIDRIERKIESLGRAAENVFKSWNERNDKLRDQMQEVANEIELQNQGAARYLEEANSVGLDEKWAKLVREGTIDIDTITDEDLADKIQQYQEWYDKYLDCIDAAEELKITEAELYQQAFDNVVSKYESYISVIEQEKNLLEAYIDHAEEAGQIASASYYQALIAAEKDNGEQLYKQRESMIKALNDAVSNGVITEGSEAWYEMVGQINDVTIAIEESKTAIQEYNNAIREIEWQIFDKMQDQISEVTSEADFLLDLLGRKELYSESGALTDEGMAAMGMHGMNYNTYMQQADAYAQEMKRISSELANDPHNQDLIERRQELLELQQESILAAENEKQAIIDMVSEGIQFELDALQELIDSYTDALDSQKDLYDYQKKIKDQTKEIAALEKQMAAYAGDNSEETKAKLQEIRVSLSEARDNLEEMEYDKYISDQKELLDDLYLGYEENLNARLDDVDALLSDMIENINANSENIGVVIADTAGDVGYTISDAMAITWSTASSGITGAIGLYGADIGSKLSMATTTLNNALSLINDNLIDMISAIDSSAVSNIESSVIRTMSGDELIPLDSNGAILGTGIMSNYNDFVSDPTNYIRSNLSSSLDTNTVVAKNSQPGNSTNTFTFEITLPNVTNYEEFKQKMQSDKKFEDMLRAMTTDRLFGGSSMKKYKM